MIPGINERFSSLISQSQTTRLPGNCASVAPISKKHVVVATAKQALSCPNICKKWGLLLKSFGIFPQKMLFLSASCPLLLFAVRELSGAVQHLKRLAFQVNIFVYICWHSATATFSRSTWDLPLEMSRNLARISCKKAKWHRSCPCEWSLSDDDGKLHSWTVLWNGSRTHAKYQQHPTPILTGPKSWPKVIFTLLY